RSVLLLEEVFDPVAGILAITGERLAVNVDEAEPVEVSVTPLKAVHERSCEVALHIYPVSDGVVDELEVLGVELDPVPIPERLWHRAVVALVNACT
ncbi:Os11g0184350, partial [Oryza sativa Japonica Group]